MICEHCLQQNGYSALYVIAKSTNHDELFRLVRYDERLDAWMRQEKHLTTLMLAAEKHDEALLRSIFASDWITPEYVMICFVCPCGFYPPYHNRGFYPPYHNLKT